MTKTDLELLKDMAADFYQSEYSALLPGEKSILKKLVPHYTNKSTFKQLEKYMEAASGWYEGVSQDDRASQELLLKLAPFMKTIAPPPSSPKILYRGLKGMKKLPEKGQRVLYSSGKNRILSGWTTVEAIAMAFRGGPYLKGGVLLKLELEKVLKDVQLVLWPGGLGSKEFVSEKEWVLYFKKPVEVTILEKGV